MWAGGARVIRSTIARCSRNAWERPPCHAITNQLASKPKLDSTTYRDAIVHVYTRTGHAVQLSYFWEIILRPEFRHVEKNSLRALDEATLHAASETAAQLDYPTIRLWEFPLWFKGPHYVCGPRASRKWGRSPRAVVVDSLGCADSSTLFLRRVHVCTPYLPLLCVSR